MARPNDYYRPLTPEEIHVLEARRCHADDWTNVAVCDGFIPERVEDVLFYGKIRLGSFRGTLTTADGVERPSGIRQAELHDVTVGDDCLIEHVHGYIARYDVADRAYISDIGTMVTQKNATFAQGRRIHVLGETGEQFVVPLHRHLTAQEAYLRTQPAKFSFSELDIRLDKAVSSALPARGMVGEGATVCHTRQVKDTYIGPHASVDSADVVDDCFLDSTKDAPVRVGAGAICRHSILAAGAAVTDGAKVNECFVGQAAHIGRGFTAESSLFFANCHLDNGEACAVCGGPFTVSHHKSTLLIGCMTSFFNAGSGTNMSNHAYKLGPIHYGTLDRGCKTASGAHLVWDGHISAFSMVMGRYACHADLSDFPFSYIFTRPDGKVMLVPGVNFATVGTYRDVRKWPGRNQCVSTADCLVSTYEELTPDTISHLRRGRTLLEELLSASPAAESGYVVDKDVLVTPKALRRGIELYRWMEQLYIARNVNANYDFTAPRKPDEAWHDALGVIFPENYFDSMRNDNRIQDTPAPDCFRRMSELFAQACACYPSFVREHIENTYTEEDVHTALEAYPDNVAAYYDRLLADAKKEYAFTATRTFIARLHKERDEELKKAHTKAKD